MDAYYFVITNPPKPETVEYSKCEPINESLFRTIVGARDPDHVENPRREAGAEATVGETTAEEARRWVITSSRRFPDGARIAWRVQKSTGIAEAWKIT